MKISVEEFHVYQESRSSVYDSAEMINDLNTKGIIIVPSLGSEMTHSHQLIRNAIYDF